MQHVHWLHDLSESLPKPDIPSAKLKQFTLEARALNAHEMAKLTENKRYALACILIRSQHSKALDDVANIFIKLIRKLLRSGQVQLDQYLLKQRSDVEKLIDSFKGVLEGYQQGADDKSRIKAIEDVIGGDAEDLIDRL
ncbi:hypothetical protein [Alkalimarinus alittae]|uniref:hypothetical protein n=1 Tax=Alkalimarinus alittae TaxID=2961619 RepID=UPI003877D904